jgi:hypothetical protein
MRLGLFSRTIFIILLWVASSKLYEGGLLGDGFDGPRWSIRVSLANLDEMNYRKIGTIIGHTLEEYAQKWKNETAKKEPVIY